MVKLHEKVTLKVLFSWLFPALTHHFFSEASIPNTSMVKRSTDVARRVSCWPQSRGDYSRKTVLWSESYRGSRESLSMCTITTIANRTDFHYWLLWTDQSSPPFLDILVQNTTDLNPLPMCDSDFVFTKRSTFLSRLHRWQHRKCWYSTRRRSAFFWDLYLQLICRGDISQH